MFPSLTPGKDSKYIFIVRMSKLKVSKKKSLKLKRKLIFRKKLISGHLNDSGRRGKKIYLKSPEIIDLENKLLN